MATLAVSVWLGACSVPDWANPVEWWRDTSGISQDDPAPDARNTQNFENGGKEPYPNLASVPGPPTNALSSAEREKLRNSLAADRANAKYVEGSDQYVAAPPKAVPSPPLNAPEPANQTQTAAAPVEATPVPAPSKPPAAAPGPGRGTETPPQESSLTPPSVRSLPQGETPRPAPPPPPGVPVSAQTQQPAPPSPPQTAAVTPAAARPDPALDPAFAGGAAQPSGAGVTLGTVIFTGKSAKLSPQILAQLRQLATLRQRNGGGTVRVTGYSEPQGEQDSMAPQLASFNLALDRARAIAAALTQDGIPLRSVEVGASPPPPGQSGGMVEILLEQ